MTLIEIVEEIEQINKSSNPDKKRLKELQKLLNEDNPKKHEKVRKILEKGDSATTSEIKYLHDKGMTINEIAGHLRKGRMFVAQLIQSHEKGEAVVVKNKRDTPLKEAIKLLESDPVISVRKVAAKTGAKEGTLYNYIKAGKIKRPDPEKKEQLAPKHEIAIAVTDEKDFEIERLQETIDIANVVIKDLRSELTDANLRAKASEQQLQIEKAKHDLLFKYIELTRSSEKGGGCIEPN